VPQWLSSIAATVIVGIMVVQLYPVAVNDLEPTRTFDTMHEMDTMEEERIGRQAEQFKERAEKKRLELRPAPQTFMKRAPEQAAPAASPSMLKQKAESLPGASLPALRSNTNAMDMELDLAAPLESGISQAREAQPESTMTAEMELKAISELINKGEIDAARKRLADFRERYPAFEIPDTLVERLQ
jgi:hypothetical protein